MIFDILIIVTTIYFAYRGYKLGVLKYSLISLTKILSIISAFIVAKRYTEQISLSFVYPNISAYINEYVTSNIDLNKLVQDLFNPAFDSSIYKRLLDLSSINLDAITELSAPQAVLFLKENITKSISYGITYILIFVVTVIVVSIAFNLILNFTDFLLKVTLLSPLNKLLGLLVGALTSLVIWLVLLSTLANVLPTITLNSGALSDQKIENTIVTKHLLNFEIKNLLNKGE